MARETRKYPTCCTAQFCGEADCPETCPDLPVLREFKEWKERTGAVCLDPIWSPLFYTTQEGE